MCDITSNLKPSFSAALPPSLTAPTFAPPLPNTSATRCSHLTQTNRPPSASSPCSSDPPGLYLPLVTLASSLQLLLEVSHRSHYVPAEAPHAATWWGFEELRVSAQLLRERSVEEQFGEEVKLVSGLTAGVVCSRWQLALTGHFTQFHWFHCCIRKSCNKLFLTQKLIVQLFKKRIYSFFKSLI